MTERLLPERKDVKRVLRDLGLSARQVDALLRGGWAALVGASQAETAELRDRLAELQAALQR
jgi:hypothetical protein